MFQKNKLGAVVIIMVLALVSGCVEIDRTNTTNSSPTAEVEITSIADSHIPELPDSNIKNYSQKNPSTTNTEVVPQTTLPSVQSIALPYSTPPTAVPTPLDYNSPQVVVSTPLPATNIACNELNNVQRQIQFLQNDRIQKNQLLYKYQSLKSDATLNGDTQLAESYQVQIDELKKMITNIDMQLSSLKARESILSRECYKSDII